MTAAAFAVAGQALAESIMSDTVRVERDGVLVTDPATGAVSNTPTVLYTGKAQIRPETSSEAGSQDAGEARDLLDQFLVKIPMAAADVQADDTVIVTASVDGSLTAARLRVIGVVRGTAVTARRLRCRLDSIGG